jgi:hypothetical protein
LTYRTYKELKKLNTKSKKIIPSIGANKLNRQFSKEVQVVNKYMKKCLASLAVREMQSK